jgi:hypothetical protein
MAECQWLTISLGFPAGTQSLLPSSGPCRQPGTRVASPAEPARVPSSRNASCTPSYPMESVLPPNASRNDALLAHNVAVLRMEPFESNRYILMGGLQAFKRRQKGGTPSSEDANFGIRHAHGVGWPPRWGTKWVQPQVVIRGSDPRGCVDRRPLQTGECRRVYGPALGPPALAAPDHSSGHALAGWPQISSCEFDGRLSVVFLKSTYFLYARANLQHGALTGGRFVQVSTTPCAELTSAAALYPSPMLR